MNAPTQIPRVSLIEVEPRPLTARLWELEATRLSGTATKANLIELDALCRVVEAEQDLGGVRS